MENPSAEKNLINNKMKTQLFLERKRGEKSITDVFSLHHTTGGGRMEKWRAKKLREVNDRCSGFQRRQEAVVHNSVENRDSRIK